MIVSDKLSTWLVRELDGRGWSHRELGRRANISGAAVSRVISGEQNPGWDFCAAVARALGQPPLFLFSLAGLLAEGKKAEKEEDLLHNYRALNQAQQNFIIDIMRGLNGAPTVKETAAPYQAGPAPPIPDDEDIMDLFQHLAPYHQRTVYDFARWTLEQQNNPYNSDLKRQQEWERRYNIGIAQLIEIVHALPSEEYDKILNFLLALKQGQGNIKPEIVDRSDKTQIE